MGRKPTAGLRGVVWSSRDSPARHRAGQTPRTGANLVSNQGQLSCCPWHVRLQMDCKQTMSTSESEGLRRHNTGDNSQVDMKCLSAACRSIPLLEQGSQRPVLVHQLRASRAFSHRREVFSDTLQTSLKEAFKVYKEWARYARAHHSRTCFALSI